ncbi:VPA1262 family N-terminal domain-containing protein [Sorangium sp. So ce327]|uniref:VPA1262 family N-terminal domain-containing protein n=1 Tax=Sorangium sp. So ce327 TaxID=3133301 RepID=UPI003F614AAE
MLIQEEAPRPADPLATLDEDYERAVLHLAWDRNAETNERTLLFALVELLPIEVPPPLDDGEQQRQPGEGSAHRVSVCRVVVPARRALAWHLDCRRGVAVLPNDVGELPDASDASAIRVVLADLGEEPPWPTLVCVSGESDTVPFCPAWHEHPRVHHLVPLADFATEKLWPGERERMDMVRWLSERLHFSLEDYPEYWGSVHLVAPNPVYRSLGTRLLPRTPPRESVLVRFQPRAGKSVEGLELTYTEKEPWGPLDVRHVVVKSPLLRLDFEREVQGTREDVLDPKRGVLAASYHEGRFIKSFQISMGLVTRQMSVRGKAPGASYEVNRMGKPEITTIGNQRANAPSARARVSEAHHARRKRGQASAQDQRWFSGQQEEAADALRALIHGARREVLIVDPHFGPDELFTFALAVAQEDVPIRILSSAEILRQSHPQARPGVDLGAALLAEVERLTSQERMSPIDIRVMTGDPPSIHDQFLVVDGRAWLLGSPLHTFGARGTMMIAMPDPAPVIERLLRAWDDAMDLRLWAQGRTDQVERREGI